MNWGVFDTVDRLWMGDDSGPKLFDEKGLAVISAMTVDMRLGTDPGRHRAKEFPEGPCILRDEVEAKMDTLEALERIEKGQV